MAREDTPVELPSEEDQADIQLVGEILGGTLYTVPLKVCVLIFPIYVSLTFCRVGLHRVLFCIGARRVHQWPWLGPREAGRLCGLSSAWWCSMYDHMTFPSCP